MVKKVKYIVSKGEAFGDYPDGAVLDAYLIAFDGINGLLFHPCVDAERKRGLGASISVSAPLNNSGTKFEWSGMIGRMSISNKKTKRCSSV